MNRIYRKDFWKAAVSRAVHTVAQTAIAVIGSTALFEHVAWLAVVSASGVAGVLSVLKSIVFGVPEVEEK